MQKECAFDLGCYFYPSFASTHWTKWTPARQQIKVAGNVEIGCWVWRWSCFALHIYFWKSGRKPSRAWCQPLRHVLLSMMPGLAVFTVFLLFAWSPALVITSCLTDTGLCFNSFLLIFQFGVGCCLFILFFFTYWHFSPLFSHSSNPSLNIYTFLIAFNILIWCCLPNIFICFRVPARSCFEPYNPPSYFLLICISHSIKPLISILSFQISSVTCVQRPSQTQKELRRGLGCCQSRRTDLHVEHVFFLFIF